jgi:hypothetical protein
MSLTTASQTVSFAVSLERDSARFYEAMSQTLPEHKEAFLSLASQNRKNILQIERSYYGIINDAYEACFCFNIDPDEYRLHAELDDDAGSSQALDRAIGMERKILRFYLAAAEQSKPVLPDVPRTFARIARQRSAREETLRSLA